MSSRVQATDLPLVELGLVAFRSTIERNWLDIRSLEFVSTTELCRLGLPEYVACILVEHYTPPKRRWYPM